MASQVAHTRRVALSIGLGVASLAVFAAGGVTLSETCVGWISAGSIGFLIAGGVLAGAAVVAAYRDSRAVVQALGVAAGTAFLALAVYALVHMGSCQA